jgi:DNA-binding winged helix-turn-helix (wHTH) protein/tetratricopeptide (TPR) repeat protein
MRFGGFELVGEHELRTGAGRVAIQPQPLRLLHVLASRPGEIVTRDELRRALWGELHLDHEHGLNFAVRQLRVALGDEAEAPRFLETVPKVGYRFVAAVERLGDVAPSSHAPPPRSPASAMVPVVAGVAAVAAVMSSLFAVPRGSMAPRVLVRPMAGAPGLSDEVILELARLPPTRMCVLAPTTAGAASATDPRSLGVSHVFEGGAAGDTVEARLTASHDGRVVWAGRVDPASPFAAAHLARELALALGTTAPSLRPRRVDAILAEGWRLLRLESPDDAERALAFFQQAARGDPGSAQAQLGLAESWRRLARPARETSLPWRDAALRAIALDPGDARGHLSLAGYRLYRERDLAGSRASFERALALAPGLAAVHDAYAAWFSAQGRHDEALAMARRAADLDPLSTGVQLDLGFYLHLARRHAEAAAALVRAHELQGSVGCLDYALRARIAGNEWDDAWSIAIRIMGLRSAAPAAIDEVRTAPDAREGVRRHLRWNLERLRSRGATAGVMALEHAWLGDDGPALRLLDDAFADGGGWVLCFLSVDPAWDGLRSRVEFQALVARARI